MVRWKTLNGKVLRSFLHMFKKSRSSCFSVLVILTVAAGSDTPLGVSNGSVSESVIEQFWFGINGVLVPAPSRLQSLGGAL